MSFRLPVMRPMHDLYGESQQELVREALELNPNNAYAQKLQGKLDSNKQLSGAQLGKLAAQNDAVIRNQDTQNALTEQNNTVGRNTAAEIVGQLNTTVQAANNQPNAAVDQANTVATQEDVAKSLRSKGISSKKADGIAEAIVGRLNGQELTRTQKNILSSALNSSAVQDVISNIMEKRSTGIDSSLKNAYDEINTIGGNEHGRETTLWNLSNKRADGSLSDSRGGTRATNEDRSGVPGTLGEDDGIFEKTLPSAQRRELTLEVDTFGDNDYATVTEGSSLHQVQNAFKEKYGIESHVIKDSSWTRSSPAYSKDGVVYIRESINPDTLSTAVPHEATHVMKQQNFQPYIDFITNTPDWLNFRSETVQKFLKMITDHIKIDPFTANYQQLFRYYDELNSTVYGLYKSGVLDSNEFDFHEYIPGAFNDFTSYIQELDRIHEQFRNRRNAPAEVMEVDGGVDALVMLVNEVDGASSAQMQNALTSQNDRVGQKSTAGSVGQLNTTLQAANNQVNQSDVTQSLMQKGFNPQKAEGIAEAITARLNGQELTKTQRKLLSSALESSAVRDTISKLIQKQSNGIDNAQNDVYDNSKIRDGLTDEEKAASENLSDPRVDAFGNHDNGTVIDGAALHQFQNTFSDEIYEGGASVSRPTWRQSELDAVADFPEYKAQKSFMNGKEVPYGTKGSVRPDYYKSGFSVDIKNYNVASASGRSNLARNIEAQYNQRIENLPDGTQQAVLIDARGQNVSIPELIVLYNDIVQRTKNGVEILFKMN